MKLSVIAICIALTAPAVWAQKYPKRNAIQSPSAPTHPHIALKFRSLKAKPLVLNPQQASPAPAPGVVQVFLNPASGVLEAAYFIATSDIPAGNTISGSMTLLDDQSYMDFQPFTLSADLQVGDSVQLPTFSNFGDVYFQEGASFDYTVLVTPTRGATTEADGTFLLGETLANSDLTSFEPVINYATQSIGSNKDVILSIPGYYTGDPVQVVLSDLFANYVPPASAVTVTATQVNVDMSQLQGFDLTSLDNLLVSLSEDGFSDTVAFRYLPPVPGSYNPAPQ